MADDRTEGQAGTGKAMRRRGILAAAGVVVAGIAMKQAVQPVAASGAMLFATGGALTTNTAAGQTELLATLTTDSVALNVDARPSADSFDAVGVLGRGSRNGAGVIGLMDGVSFPGAQQQAGVYGVGGPSGAGVIGVSGSSAPLSFRGTGVMGVAYGATALSGVTANATAVLGNAQGTTMAGVTGYSGSGAGAFGASNTGNGVIGNSSSNHGVVGQSYMDASANGSGVYGYVAHVGTTQVTAGVFGSSDASYGVIGRTTAANYSGCTGIANLPNTSAFAGAGTGGAYAAYFTGPTVIDGDFTVVGGHQKNAAVKHTDGSYRLLHCVESPEPWFEDFGKVKLVNGRANVKLDADFAAVVDATDYHVFLTPYGGIGALRVASVRADGFEVEEIGATGSGTFSYRIVAKRKDINPGRMAKFELPKIRLPKPEEMPPPPAPPKKP